jgi:hypothetical protein
VRGIGPPTEPFRTLRRSRRGQGEVLKGPRGLLAYVPVAVQPGCDLDVGGWCCAFFGGCLTVARGSAGAPSRCPEQPGSNAAHHAACTHALDPTKVTKRELNVCQRPADLASIPASRLSVRAVPERSVCALPGATHLRRPISRPPARACRHPCQRCADRAAPPIRLLCRRPARAVA